MAGYNPKRPSGYKPDSLFHQSTWDKNHGQDGKFNNSSTVKVRKTSRGYSWHAAPASGANSSGQKLYKTTNLVSENYIFAEPWDPSVDNGDGTFGAPSGAPVAVAKCLPGRMPLSELIDGIQYTYVYGDMNGDNGDNIRKASAPGQSDEWHVMHERYTAEPLHPELNMPDAPGRILAAKVSGGTGVTDLTGAQITMTEVSSRAGWTYQDTQSGLLTS